MPLDVRLIPLEKKVYSMEVTVDGPQMDDSRLVLCVVCLRLLPSVIPTVLTV